MFSRSFILQSENPFLKNDAQDDGRGYTVITQVWFIQEPSPRGLRLSFSRLIRQFPEAHKKEFPTGKKLSPYLDKLDQGYSIGCLYHT